jgi:flavorubredoxin
MHTVIVFDSEFGNTREVGEAIARELRAQGEVEMVKVDTARVGALASRADLVLVGGPTQVHGLSTRMRTFLDSLPVDSLAGKAAAAFDTRMPGWRFVTGAASTSIAKRLERHGAHLVVQPESFLVTAKEGPLANEEVARARIWAQRIVAALSEQQAVV